jgi:hypothetical protein
MDNFSGHDVGYDPKNIKIIFFAPNLTAWIQPCDAGIIRNFKALYRIAYVLNELEMNKVN